MSGLPTGHAGSSASAVQLALLHRLRPVNEIFGSDLGTRRRRQLAGLRIDLHPHHSRRCFKLADVPVLPMLMRPAHEFRPHRQGRMRALQVQLAVVVESHPHDANQFRREAGKPAVVRRPRFACYREINSPRPHTRARSGPDHFLEQLIHQERHARVQHVAMFRLVVVQDRTVVARDIGNEIRLRVNPVIGENRIRAGDFERRHLIGAQRHRGRRMDLHVHSRTPRQIHDRIKTGLFRQLHCGDVQGVRQRIPQRYVAVELVLEIARLVRFPVEIKRGRLVHDHGGRRNHLPAAR